MDIVSDLFIELEAMVLHGHTKSLANAYVMVKRAAPKDNQAGKIK